MAMVQFDYESVKNRLVESLQNKMEGRILDGSTAMYLLEAFAEEFDRVSAYNEYLTRENKWSLAQNTSSILTQLELFGYKAHRKKGAAGIVEVSASENFSTKYPVNVLIPKFTRFSDGNLTYCSTQDVTLTSSNAYVEVPVIQGEVKTTGEFLGNSFSGDVYTIKNPDIEDDLYELRNNNVVCSEVDWFGQTQLEVNNEDPTTYVYNNFEYKIKNISDFSGIQIEFAPNSHDVNDHFEFRYLITEGKNGSCFDSYPNGITKVLNSVVDSQGVSVKLYVRNTKPISGGRDYETVDEMRLNAPYSFNRVDKIITRNDYISAIREILPGSIFQIWTEASLKYAAESEVVDMQDAKDFINNSKIFFSGVNYNLSNRTVTPIESSELQSVIAEKINDKKGMTDYFIIDDPEVWKFYINGKVYFNLNKISSSLLKSQISDNILAKYPVDKAQFDTPAYRSDYTTVFSDIYGIDHVDINAVMYTQIFLNHQEGETKVYTVKKDNFNFIPANSSEISISDQYIFTSARNTGELLEDLFMLKYADGNWNFYTPDGLTKLSNNDPTNDAVRWKDTSEDFPAHLNEIQININTPAGKEIWYGNSSGTPQDDHLCKEDDVHLVCRFVPENFNCTLTSKDQILIYSDSMAEEGILNPWATYNGKKAGMNWWITENDPVKYGLGIDIVVQ